MDAPAERIALSGLWRRIGPSLVISIVAPVLVYELIRSTVDSDAVALAIGAGAPVLWTLGRLAITRVVDVIGVVGCGLYGIGLLVVWLSGGSPLALELRDAVPTGLVGLACLVSVLVRRPLHAVVLRLAGRPNRPTSRFSFVVTTLIGGTLVVHALALIALALSLPTGTYVGLSQPVGLAIIAAGVAVLFWYRHRALPAAS
jgi:hypothetical protein